MHILNNIFDNIYILYINDEEIYSIKKIISCTNLVIEYFKGYNGYNDANSNLYLKKGEIGHLKSIILILKDAIKNNYKNILILEPDIYFCENFSNIMSSYSFSNFKLLYLGATQNKFYNELTWPNIEIKSNYYRAYKTLGTFAIGINISIYEEIITLLQNFNKPTDVALTEIQNKYEKCYVIYPNIICCNVIKSTTNLSTLRNQISFSNDVKWSRSYIYTNYYKKELKAGLYKITMLINSKLMDYEIYFNNNFPPITNTNNIINTLNVNRKYHNPNLLIIYINVNNNLEFTTKNIFLQNITYENVKFMSLNMENINNINNTITLYYNKIIRLQ